MIHYDIQHWTDYVRGLGGASRRSAMSEHIAAGCRRCGELVESLKSVVADAAGEHEPPNWAVRSVKVMFALHRPRSTVRRRRAQLTFDSLLAAAPVGTRSDGCTSRHLVYNAQDFVLDLRMDYSQTSREMLVVGQVVQRHGIPVPNVPTFLIAGDRLLSRSLTGRLGEFHMECRPKGNLKLCLSISEDELIEVELDRRHSEGDSARSEECSPVFPLNTGTPASKFDARSRNGSAQLNEED